MSLYGRLAPALCCWNKRIACHSETGKARPSQNSLRSHFWPSGTARCDLISGGSRTTPYKTRIISWPNFSFLGSFRCPSLPSPSPIRTILSAIPIILDVTLREQIEWPTSYGITLVSQLGLRPLEDSSRRTHGRARKGPDPTEVL